MLIHSPICLKLPEGTHLKSTREFKYQSNVIGPSAPYLQFNLNRFSMGGNEWIFSNALRS